MAGVWSTQDDVLVRTRPRLLRLPLGLAQIYDFAVFRRFRTAVRRLRRASPADMAGRRTEDRFGLSVPREGVFRISRDLDIDHREDDEIYAISDTPEPIGRICRLLDDVAGERWIEVRLEECNVVTINGRVRYRLRLAVLR
jgi:hypothetical protein